MKEIVVELLYLTSSCSPPIAQFAYDDGRAGGAAAARVLLHLRVSNNMLEGSTGCAQWSAGFFLAELMLARPELFAGRRVVELGAGAGAAGIVCARAPAGARPASLVLTDGSPAAIANLRENLARNGVAAGSGCAAEGGACCIARLLDWDSATEESLTELAGADTSLAESQPLVVVGADLIYDPNSIAALVRCLRLLLRPWQRSSSIRPMGLMINALRNADTLDRFVRESREAGLDVTDVTKALRPPVAIHHQLTFAADRIIVHRIFCHESAPA